MPLLIARYLRSSHDKFIEQATLALGYCEDKYVDELIEKYEEIRSDYAKAEFCVVLGFSQKKECVNLLRREAKRLSARRSEYKDGPLLVLDMI